MKEEIIDIRLAIKPLAIVLAIIDLAFTYFAFVQQQYFSIWAMSGLLLLGLISAILFFEKEFKDKRTEKIFYVVLLFLSMMLIIYEVTFDRLPPNIWQIAQMPVVLVSAATVASMAGIYLVSRELKKIRKPKTVYIYILIASIFLAFVAYAIMYISSNFQWNGVDELSFNYYAATLFVHGQNPYTASMQPIITQNHIFPTVQRNGTYEYAYDYPALSFLPFIFMPLLGITNFLYFIWFIIFIAILSSFLVLYRSGFKSELYPLCALWLIVSYALVGVVAQYIAISVFMLLAYLERKRIILSGILLGLAASTIQLAWFALPFFYILTYKEHGRGATIRSIAATAAVFFVINIYFILLSPATTLRNMFELFGLGKLMAYGINLVQFSISFYPLPSWYFALLAGALYLFLITAFYLKPNRLRLFLALVPMYIFFLSWRNISIYGIPFIPLIFAMHFCDKEHQQHHESKIRMSRIAAAACFVLISFVIIAVFANSSYTNANTLQIKSLTPIIYVQQGYYGLQPSLGGMRINVTNNGKTNETVSFLMESRSPNNEAYMLGSTVHQLSPGMGYNYTLNYTLPLVNNNTRLLVIVFSQDYIVSKKFNITISLPSSFPH